MKTMIERYMDGDMNDREILENGGIVLYDGIIFVKTEEVSSSLYGIYVEPASKSEILKQRLSVLYFLHPFATNEQIEQEIQRRVDAQIQLAYNQTR